MAIGGVAWTELPRDEREALILKGIQSGGTLRGLAREFGASESSVIGQWHRLCARTPGLSLETARDARPEPAKSKPVRRERKVAATKPIDVPTTRGARRPSSPTSPVSPPPAPRPRPAPAPAKPVEALSAEDIRAGAISLLHATVNQCRSIVGEASAMLVCGRPTDPTKSFCPYHQSLYYVPVASRRAALASALGTAGSSRPRAAVRGMGAS